VDPTSKPADLTSLVERSRSGNAEALTALREASHESLTKILMARGAAAHEAQDVLADFWADCVPKNEETPALLDKFSGRCSFIGWAGTVVTRRWIDLKRKQQRHTELDTSSEPDGPSLEQQEKQSDDSLLLLVRDALQTAFSRCPPEGVVLLRLLHVHGLTQRELGRMLGWNETRTSRFLSSIIEKMQKETFREIKRQDPWLELGWDDLVNVCGTYEAAF